MGDYCELPADYYELYCIEAVMVFFAFWARMGDQ